MWKSMAGAVVIFLAAVPPVAAAQGESAFPDEAPPARSASAPTGQSIRNDGAGLKQGIKNTAGEVKQGFKSGAASVKRGVAVAQCNDGEYSYTHHTTCNHHGGVRHQLR